MATKFTMNPWFGMWVRPREMIRQIIAENPRFRFGILSFLYGLPSLFHVAQNFSLGLHFPLSVILGGAVVLGIVYGLLSLSIMSALIYWTGKWLKGAASYLEIRAAVSWSNVTNIVPVCLWVLLILLCGQGVFDETFMQGFVTSQNAGILFPFFLLQFVVSIWSFVILFQALGEVQKFSAWMALLNVFIPFALVVGGIWVLMGAIWWIQTLVN